MSIENYLSTWFNYSLEYEVYVSKKRHLGAGTGDDRSLYISIDPLATSIWWKNNRGSEKTIFEGKSIKTVEELEILFELLELKIFRILN